MRTSVSSKVLSQISTGFESLETTVKVALVWFLPSVHASVRLQSVNRREAFATRRLLADPRLAVAMLLQVLLNSIDYVYKSNHNQTRIHCRSIGEKIH